MPRRSDEIEADEPRRRRSTRRYDDEPDERDEDDDLRDLRRKKPRPRSGLVLAAGIVTIVMGGLYLACGVLGGGMSLFCAGIAPVMQQGLAQAGDAQAAQEMAQAQRMAWLGVFESLLNLAIGVSLLASGICVIRRWNWARFTVIGVAGVAVVIEFFDILLKLVLGMYQSPGDAVIGISIFFLALAFAGFVSIALLLPVSNKDFVE